MSPFRLIMGVSVAIQVSVAIVARRLHRVVTRGFYQSKYKRYLKLVLIRKLFDAFIRVFFSFFARIINNSYFASIP